MRRILILLLFSCLVAIKSYSQSSDSKTNSGDKVSDKAKTTSKKTLATKAKTKSRNSLSIDDSNTWAIGGGISNFIMHGDLRSFGTGELGNFYNFGGYLSVSKMFNPILGVELKGSYTKMSGGAQYFSEIYDVLYVPNTVIRNNMYFEGNAYGAELNLILSFSNLHTTKAEKWHVAGYFGLGYHQYDSQLFEKSLTGGPDKELVDYGKNPRRNSENQASSIYLSGQLGIKRKISNRVDIELRTGMYFNNEDHLDATISNKQDWETFFVTSLGVSIKLGKQKEFTIWEGSQEKPQFKIVDTDKDGVMDELDIEPNTPAGVMVYGNGKAVDSDNDGLPDYKDKCPLEYGPESNEGCPLNIDSDGDGIMDNKDLCPNTPGTVENRGCPEQQSVTAVTITQQIGLLAASIYFDTNSDRIKPISFGTIDKIIGLMKKIPDVEFVVEGHTDDRNSDRYNLYLSQRRANAVRKYMVVKGIANDRLTAKGYGESRPKFSNTNAGGRQLNRRVEIKAADDID